MSDQNPQDAKNARNAAPEAPAPIDEMKIEPLEDESIKEAARGNCSVHHCSVMPL